MVYLEYKKINDTKAKVNFIHFRPEELEDTSRGLLVESIPEPEYQEGKTGVLYINPETQELWYEYVDVPNVLPGEELQNRVEELEQAILELSMLVGGGN